MGGGDGMTNNSDNSDGDEEGDNGMEDVEAEDGDGEDGVEEQEVGRNQSNQMSTESKKLPVGVQSQQYALYLRIITSPLFSQFLEDSNSSKSLPSSVEKYENYLHAKNEKCQLSSCAADHVQYSSLCQRHLDTFIHSNMVQKIGRTRLQSLFDAVTDSTTQTHQFGLSRTNYQDIPRDPPQREREKKYEAGQNPFIIDQADVSHRRHHSRVNNKDGHSPAYFSEIDYDGGGGGDDGSDDGDDGDDGDDVDDGGEAVDLSEEEGREEQGCYVENNEEGHEEQETADDNNNNEGHFLDRDYVHLADNNNNEGLFLDGGFDFQDFFSDEYLGCGGDGGDGEHFPLNS